MTPRVTPETYRTFNRVCKDIKASQGECIEILMAYRLFNDPKEFKAFAKVMKEKGDIYALDTDGRMKIRNLLNPLRLN